MVFASEEMWPPLAQVETTESIDVAAPPISVWQALIDMQTMEALLALPFRLGMAYPISGRSSARVSARSAGACSRPASRSNA
jgi:hypothetical protein